MMCTLGDISVTGGTFGGGFGSDVGRLHPLWMNKLVVVATGDNVVGVWCGTVTLIGGATTLRDEVFVGDRVGAVVMLVLNISAS